MINLLLGFIKTIRKALKQNCVVIVPPAGYGSIGDDAMVRVLIRHSLDSGFKPMILSGKEAISWQKLGDIKINIADSDKKIHSFFNLLILLLCANKLYFIGADIMDGHYDSNSVLKRIKLADIFSKAGIAVTFTGFSFNDNPNKEVCQALQQLQNVHFYIRDAVSFERYKKHVNDVAELSADLAFLTKSSLANTHVNDNINWINTKKNKHNILIIVNINFIPFRKTEFTLDNIIKRYSDICLQIYNRLDKKAAILIVPNDFRDPDNYGDIKLGKLLYKSIVPTLTDDCRMVDTEFNSEELKSFTEKCDFAITGRMHLGIICATNFIPSFSVSYQQKFAGFYQILGLSPEELMIEPGDLFDNNIFNKILSNIEKTDHLKQTIRDNFTKVKDYSQKNFN